MKKTIASIIIIVIILGAMTSVLILADKLFYRESAETAVTQETYSSNGVESLVIGIDVGYINITENKSSDSFSVNTVGYEKDFYSVTVENGTLSVKSSELEWYDREIYNSVDKYGVTVSIPSSFEGDVKILTKAGSISISDVTLSSLRATSEAGEIHISNPSISVMELSTDVGDISVENARADKVTLKSDVGDLSFSDAKSFVSSLNATADVGDINLSLCGDREQYAINAVTSTGKCNVENGGDGIYVDASTGTGDIKVTFSR